MGIYSTESRVNLWFNSSFSIFKFSFAKAPLFWFSLGGLGKEVYVCRVAHQCRFGRDLIQENTLYVQITDVLLLVAIVCFVLLSVKLYTDYDNKHAREVVNTFLVLIAPTNTIFIFLFHSVNGSDFTWSLEHLQRFIVFVVYPSTLVLFKKIKKTFTLNSLSMYVGTFTHEFLPLFGCILGSS